MSLINQDCFKILWTFSLTWIFVPLKYLDDRIIINIYFLLFLDQFRLTLDQVLKIELTKESTPVDVALLDERVGILP